MSKSLIQGWLLQSAHWALTTSLLSQLTAVAAQQLTWWLYIMMCGAAAVPTVQLQVCAGCTHTCGAVFCLHCSPDAS
jgi:hypothetical protein